MRELVGTGAASRTAAAAFFIITAGGLSGCAPESLRSPRDQPLLLKDNEAVLIRRDEIARYRCAYGAILQCGGANDQSAQCVCSPFFELWPAR